MVHYRSNLGAQGCWGVAGIEFGELEKVVLKIEISAASYKANAEP